MEVVAEDIGGGGGGADDLCVGVERPEQHRPGGDADRNRQQHARRDQADSPAGRERHQQSQQENDAQEGDLQRQRSGRWGASFGGKSALQRGQRGVAGKSTGGCAGDHLRVWRPLAVIA